MRGMGRKVVCEFGGYVLSGAGDVESRLIVIF
jgi:hypothetical protein